MFDFLKKPMGMGLDRLSWSDFRVVLANDENPRFADFAKYSFGRIQTVHAGHGDIPIIIRSGRNDFAWFTA